MAFLDFPPVFYDQTPLIIDLCSTWLTPPPSEASRGPATLPRCFTDCGELGRGAESMGPGAVRLSLKKLNFST